MRESSQRPQCYEEKRDHKTAVANVSMSCETGDPRSG